MNNLRIFPRQENVAVFYNSATVVVNLTDRHLAVETFGLTSLEAMSCGLPVIVPTVGGIAEFVVDGYNGYMIDVQNLPEIEFRISEMMGSKELYRTLSDNALTVSQRYDARSMTTAVSAIFAS